MKAKAGGIIIRQGDTGDRFFLVRTGRVQIIREEQTIVAELGEGDHFGETALLTGQPRNATVKALEPSSLYYLAKLDFQAAMAKSVTLEEEVRYSVFDR